MLELLQRAGLIWGQVESGVFVARDGDGVIVNAIIDPVFGDVQGLGELRHGQIARDMAGVRLTAFSEDSMFNAEAFNGAGQEFIAQWGSEALYGKPFGDLNVRIALASE